jgi:hypothetical protein
MGVPNGGPYRGPISPSVLKCQNDKMAKWPNDAIEGVNVLKVIPRPTALSAVGKKYILFSLFLTIRVQRQFCATKNSTKSGFLESDFKRDLLAEKNKLYKNGPKNTLRQSDRGAHEEMEQIFTRHFDKFSGWSHLVGI